MGRERQSVSKAFDPSEVKTFWIQEPDRALTESVTADEYRQLLDLYVDAVIGKYDSDSSNIRQENAGMK